MLSLFIWIPIVAAIIICFLPSFKNTLIYRNIALTIAGITCFITIILGLNFQIDFLGLQFTESFVWLSWLGLSYDLGVDGLSFPLLCINSLLTFISLYITPKDIQRPRFYYGMILLLSGGVAGAFLAQNLLLFFLFYEIEIVPLYFLIAVWGGAKRGYAAMKFLLYTALSGFLVLISFLGLVWLSGEVTFAFEPLKSHSLTVNSQLLLLIPLLIGLFIKIPIFPFHTWLPDAHVEASTPVSVLLAGVLLKLGTYGLLRFGIGFFRDAWVICAPYLAILAGISALYGATCAIAQKDMKKVVAYSSIAHMAYILLAAAATTRLSINASILQMISHGLISAMLFILVGIVYKKTGSRDVNYLRGLLNPEKGLPITGSLMIVAVMASSGIPGMVGFISEFLVFRGSFPIFPIPTLLCLIGTGLTAVYFLLMVNKVFFGRLTPELSDLPKVLWSEKIPALFLAFLIVIFGLQPHLITRWSETQATVILYGNQQLLSNKQ
ncbi:NADH-quinone oxidoreductase subunit M [Geminocystis sp. GBBB08]|uniref:NADH-quinone oxidoreductase subunit M n=1 Tax=Geminocystis sp. GBBB08 TaxID=2604140 RepID=UPI0027E24B97|nr:NADH-quinone oxidoreductase subunit M [Geminocystis sp. GBBB08]MBL1209677.1 NADH-quinone oxidoreductase subunit M [Geminocystis sp. GBBB08]